MEYYLVLRGALRSAPHLRDYLVRCRHCRIFFLCDPRNSGRKDLGCPFGCREAHRRKRSSERSTAYYQTQAGKVKKAALNGERRQVEDHWSAPQGASSRIESDEIRSPAETRPEEKRVPVERRPGGIQFSAEIVEHVRMVTSLIEGFAVTQEEVLSMLERVVRQHSILGKGRRAYFLHWLAEHSP